MPIQLQSLMDKFVQTQKLEKGDRTYETYGRKIYVFQEYMIRVGKNDDNCGAFLHEAKISDILDSIRYYVDTYKIRYRSTIDTFFWALATFFKYIKITEGISNEYYYGKSSELKNAYDDFAKKLKLNEKEQAFPLAEDECERLIALCNEKLDTPSKEEILNGANNGIYTLYISSLITKFVLLYGTKNQDIIEMQINSYNRDLNKISIRGYCVHLPDILASQMRKYTDIRNMIVPASSYDNRLFIDINPGQKLENAKMFSALKVVTGHSKAMSVAKHAIIQMMKSNVSYNLIMDFTGYGNDVCGHCQELVDEENGIFQLSEKNRKLDSALRQNRFFDAL